MYVCNCRAVTDWQIREAAENGTPTWKALTRELGASTQCGKCGIEAKRIFDQARSDMAAKQTVADAQICQAKSESCCGKQCQAGCAK